jgi:ATP:ADP antiporter, AAA family
MRGAAGLSAGRLIWTAMWGAGLMLAHQVAGKAVRDSFFLTNYPVSDLPKMVIAAAAVSLLAVFAFANVMGRFGPRRLVPAGFLLSSLAHVVERFFVSDAPGPWSVAIYLHIVALGAILLSGFWSQVSELFDPRTAKLAFGRIAGAGTLGGIAGGAMAERIAALAGPADVLLLLAALHLLCAMVLVWLRGMSAGPAPAVKLEPIPPRELFRRAPYLIPIAVLVLAGTSSAAIVDYLFKSEAGAAFGKGAPMLRFFAVFYTSTQILTFLAQTFLARPSLQRLGIGRTISALPLGVGAGSLAALLFPAFPVLVLLRSLESVLRGSMFRSGYELLYTPVPAAEKRAAKTLIDVGCDRAGDALGGGVVQLLLSLGLRAPFLTPGLLGVVLALVGVAAWIALRVDRAYTGLVEQRLVDRAVELDLADLPDSTTRTAIFSAKALRAGAVGDKAPAVSGTPTRPWDPTLRLLHELRSGDRQRVLAALGETDSPGPLLAAQLLRLLAWDEVSDAVRQALTRNASRLTGLMIDHLAADEAVLFGIRRRIPCVLARSDSQLAVHGLIGGLADSRFEVRFQCSRALDFLHQRRPELEIPAQAVFAAVERELQVARPIWESRRLLDRRDDSDPAAFLDEHLRERADRSLEHVFSLFAAVLAREPVRIAFRALHTEDRQLRGLAVEYLEGVLPPEVRERLWSLIEPQPAPAGPPRSHDETVAELLRSHDSLLHIVKAAGPPR